MVLIASFSHRRALRRGTACDDTPRRLVRGNGGARWDALRASQAALASLTTGARRSGDGCARAGVAWKERPSGVASSGQHGARGGPRPGPARHGRGGVAHEERGQHPAQRRRPPPAMTTAVRNPAANSSGMEVAVPGQARRSAGSRATAISPPARATSLLTAEATPACSTGADDSAVDGERGHGDDQADAEDEHRRAGPRSGSRPTAPIRRQQHHAHPHHARDRPPSAGGARCAPPARPERAEKASMMAVRGRSEVPASSGL